MVSYRRASEIENVVEFRFFLERIEWVMLLKSKFFSVFCLIEFMSWELICKISEVFYD